MWSTTSRTRLTTSRALNRRLSLQYQAHRTRIILRYGLSPAPFCHEQLLISIIELAKQPEVLDIRYSLLLQLPGYGQHQQVCSRNRGSDQGVPRRTSQDWLPSVVQRACSWSRQLCLGGHAATVWAPTDVLTGHSLPGSIQLLVCLRKVVQLFDGRHGPGRPGCWWR